MSAWLHLRWMRDTPGNSLIAVRGKRGGWKRELDDRRATRTTNLIEREGQRERERRWKLESEKGEGEREREGYSQLCFERSRNTSCLSLSFVPLHLLHPPPPPRPAISSPFRDVCNRFERLERPREPTRASAFSACITVSPRSSRSSRVARGIQLPITRLHGPKKRELGMLCQRFPRSSPRLHVPLHSHSSSLGESIASMVFKNRWISMTYKIYRFSLVITGGRIRRNECRRFQFPPVFFFF